MSQLNRRQRELLDLQRQVDLAREQLANDRAAQDQRETEFTEAQNQQARQAEDKGFQDSLALFQSMPSKQVKTVFMGMPDDGSVARYLQAMPPRAASRIIKEFKTPDEAARIQRVLDRVRSGAQASATGN
jgi:hypothetical protein